jgi:hypothetical protein
MRLFALILLVAAMLTAGAACAAAQEQVNLDPSQPSSPQAAQPPSEQASQQISQQALEQTSEQFLQQFSEEASRQFLLETQAAANAPDKSKIVYVSDFELDAVDANGKLQKSVPAIPPSNTPRVDPRQEPSPVERAGRLVDFMSNALTKELQKAGYPTHRLRPGDARPSDGIRVSGIFGEPDAQNRLRRAVLGRVSADGKMLLFVGVANLARPDQALYAPADPVNGDNRAGAVITVSSYAPVAKFEIEQNATEKDVKDTAAGIVRDLGPLLSANAIASTQ